MFIRKKPNKSGVVSVQIVDKSYGNYRVVETVGSSREPAVVEELLIKARHSLNRRIGQVSLNFDVKQEEALIDLFFEGK